MPTEADAFDDLRTVNEVLAACFGAEEDAVADLRRAIECFENEVPAEEAARAVQRFVEAAARVHAGNRAAGPAFAHWHVPSPEACEPLWMRRAIVGEMKKLAGRRDAVLVVTGLRDAIASGRVAAARGRREYRRARARIDALAAAWAGREMRLRVLAV